MKLVRRIGYKLIVILCIIMTYCCFIASTPVDASKVSTSEFYYSGTTKGSYTINKGIIEKIVESLGAIFDYLIGILSMVIRIPIVGWTAVAEQCLTWLIQGATGEDVEIEAISQTDITDNKDYITLDAIFFNRVPLLNINMFNFESSENDALGNEPEEEVTTGDTDDENDEDDGLVMILKKAIAGWYYTLRLISIMVMLILLVYIGIKIGIQSATSEKALYKRVLLDWIIGMILVFTIHYIMLFIIQFNEVLLEKILLMREGKSGLEVYEYGLEERAQEPVENDELEMTLYDEVKTRAYDLKLSVGLTGMVMYGVLVYYAYKFTFIYLKRYLTVAVLVIIAPLIAVSYAFNKVNSGKSQSFSKWLKEFFFIVILQSIHALFYVVFLDIALSLSLSSISAILLVFVLLNFMCKAEALFRKIFNIKGNLTQDIAAGGGIKDALNSLKTVAVVPGGAKVAKAFTKTVGRVITKPLRQAGNAAFGKMMASSVNKGGALSKVKENFENKEKDRLQTEKDAELALKIFSGKIGELEKEISNLMKNKGKLIKDADGNIKVNNDEYIKSREKELMKLKAFEANNDEEKRNEILAQYANDQKKINKFKYSINEKWAEILDPDLYTTEELDGTRKRIKTEREYGHFGKKTNSVGKNLAEKLKPENLLGIDKETKANLMKQVEFSKNAITGFAGIVIGLPLLVAEPAIGAAFFYKGVENSNKVFSRRGRIRRKNLKKIREVSNGKYVLAGFEGNSSNEIANEAKRSAKEWVAKLVWGRQYGRVQSVRQRVAKHPKLYKALKFSANVGKVGVTGVATVGSVSLGVAPAVIGATLASGVVYKVVGNYCFNATLDYKRTKKSARKAKQKEHDEKYKKHDEEYFNEYMNDMADNYIQVEIDQKVDSIDKNKTLLFSAIMTKKAEEAAKIDEMSIDEVKRNLDYEDVKIQKENDGTIKLSGDSERKIIDNAIIDEAQKSGIKDFSQYVMSDKNKQQVAKEVSTKLRQLGIMQKSQNISELIPDLDKKIKDRQAKLSKEALNGTNPIEERMADKAIIAVMKEKQVTNPDQVVQEDVFDKFKEIEKASFGGEPDKSSQNIIEKMQQGRPDVNSDNKYDTMKDTIKDTMRIGQIISSRKTILAEKAKSDTTVTQAKQMKEMLKRKSDIEIETHVQKKQIELNESEEVSFLSAITRNATVEATENEATQNTQTNTQTKNTDSIIEELIANTMRDSNEFKILVGKRSKEEARNTNYMAMNYNEDGIININPINDGSKSFNKNNI